jgi:hypothetical protein
VKRIDIFIERESNKKQLKSLETLQNLLIKINIPYKIYYGTPKSNVPYKQSKEGDSSQFTYKPVSKPKFFNIKLLYFPWKIDKIFKITPNPEIYSVKNDKLNPELPSYIRIPSIFNNTTIFSSSNFPDFYIIDDEFIPEYNKDEPSKKNVYHNIEQYEIGQDYSSPITQKLFKNLKVKNMKELGFEDIIKKYYDSLSISSYKEITRDSGGYGEFNDYQIKNINTFLDRKITLIPKDLVDKYFIKIPSSINDKIYQRKGILKNI